MACQTDRRFSAELERSQMIEAGHACAIPTCRASMPLEIEHTDDWSTVKDHRFENMIVLCANCHGRKGSGRNQIDRKSLRRCKANLGLINGRYSDVERRVLEVFALHRQQQSPDFTALLLDLHEGDWARSLAIQLPGSMRLMMLYLIKDGYVELAPAGTTFVAFLGLNLVPMRSTPALNGVVPDVDYYRLTPSGLAFLDAWLGAGALDDNEAVDTTATAERRRKQRSAGPRVVPEPRRSRSSTIVHH